MERRKFCNVLSSSLLLANNIIVLLCASIWARYTLSAALEFFENIIISSGIQSMTMSYGACCIVAWVVSCIGIIVGGFGIYFAIVHDYEADALEKSIPDYHSGYHPSHVHNFPSQQGGLVKKSVPSYYLLFFKDQDYELLKL